MTPEELGQGLATVCLSFLEQHNQEPQPDEAVQLEEIAFIYVLYRIAIEFCGPEDASIRRRIYSGFDNATSKVFSPEFLALTDQRGPYYGKCIRENWKSDNVGKSLGFIFNQFCLGSESPGQGPIRIGDAFECFNRTAFVSAAFAAIWGTCAEVFQKVEIHESQCV